MKKEVVPFPAFEPEIFLCHGLLNILITLYAIPFGPSVALSQKQLHMI